MITFSHADEDLSVLLSQLEAELNQEKWQGIILGAIDSLIDESTCLALYEQNSLQTLNRDYGVIPGEAAAFVLLQTRPALPALACIDMVSSVQPASSHSEENLISAIQQVLNRHNLTSDSIETVLFSYGSHANDPVAWCEVMQTIWPFDSKKNSHLIEEWNLHTTLGDLGAAQMPVSLILACERLQYPFPSSHHVLSIEKHERFGCNAMLCSLDKN